MKKINSISIMLLLVLVSFAAGIWFYMYQSKPSWKDESIKILLDYAVHEDGVNKDTLLMKLDSLTQKAREEAAREESYENEVQLAQGALKMAAQNIEKLINEPIPNTKEDRAKLNEQIDLQIKDIYQIPNLPQKDVERIVSNLEDATFIESENIKEKLQKAKTTIDSTINSRYLKDDIREEVVQHKIKSAFLPDEFDQILMKGDKFDSAKAEMILREKVQRKGLDNARSYLNQQVENLENPVASEITSQIKKATGDNDLAIKIMREFSDNILEVKDKEHLPEFLDKVNDFITKSDPKISKEDIGKILNIMTDNLPVSEDTRQFLNEGKEIGSDVKELMTNLEAMNQDGIITDDEKASLDMQGKALLNQFNALGNKAQVEIQAAERNIKNAENCIQRTNRMISKLSKQKQDLIYEQKFYQAITDSCEDVTYHSAHENYCSEAPKRLRKVEYQLNQMEQALENQIAEKKQCEEEKKAAEKKIAKWRMIKFIIASSLLAIAVFLAFFNPALALAFALAAFSLLGSGNSNGNGNGSNNGGSEYGYENNANQGSDQGVASEEGPGSNNQQGGDVPDPGSGNVPGWKPNGTQGKGSDKVKDQKSENTSDDSGLQSTPKGDKKGGGDTENQQNAGNSGETNLPGKNDGNNTNEGSGENANTVRDNIKNKLPIIGLGDQFEFQIYEQDPEVILIYDRYEKKYRFVFRKPKKMKLHENATIKSEMGDIDFQFNTAYLCGITPFMESALLTYIDMTSNSVMQFKVQSYSMYENEMSRLPDSFIYKLKEKCENTNPDICCAELLDTLITRMITDPIQKKPVDPEKKEKGEFPIPGIEGEDYKIEADDNILKFTNRQTNMREYCCKLSNNVQIRFICGINISHNPPTLDGITIDGHYISIFLSPYQDFVDGNLQESEIFIIPDKSCESISDRDSKECCKDMDEYYKKNGIPDPEPTSKPKPIPPGPEPRPEPIDPDRVIIDHHKTEIDTVFGEDDRSYIIKFVPEEKQIFLKVFLDGEYKFFGAKNLIALNLYCQEVKYKIKKLCHIKTEQGGEYKNYLVGSTEDNRTIIYPLQSPDEDASGSLTIRILNQVLNDCK